MIENYWRIKSELLQVQMQIALLQQKHEHLTEIRLSVIKKYNLPEGKNLSFNDEKEEIQAQE